MARDDSTTNRQMRLRIAQLAARIMAEDGIDDVGLAKRKAARQAGAPDTRNLPDNDQVESALREYLQIYRADEQFERIERLRRDALELMTLLDRFDPHLVGPVLSGSASKHAEIDLQLFTDSPKGFELFLINRNIEFATRESRFWVGGEARSACVYEIEAATAPARIVVFTGRDIRQPIRTTQEGRPMERARATAVQQLLQAAKHGDAA